MATTDIDNGPRTRTATKASALRRMLAAPGLDFLMEAHNGLSACIVEEAGFGGIWASGLAMSAQCGVRDNNELSWTQVVERLEFMSDATSIPILLDGDTGYGDFNSVRRLIAKLEQRGIAGVCIEDKLFPKTNSFIGSERQPLADIDEFCGKIKAGKDSQRDPDFCLVARVEALIAGRGMDEALKRAHAYVDAGADAILIHSKGKRADEILSFAENWNGRAPLVIVPTTYYSTPTDVFRRADIRLVIWANHMVRSSISAMQETAARVHREQSLVDVEDRIAPVKEVFRLQGAPELIEAERRYMPGPRPETRAIVLGATRGLALASLTEDRPKLMVPVAGRPVLHRLLESFRGHGVQSATVVAGYRAEAVDAPGAEVVVNDRHETSGELGSFSCALDALEQDNVIVYGDLLFRDYVLGDLLDMDAPVVAVVDSAPVPFDAAGKDFAWCSDPDDRGIYRQNVTLQHVSAEPTWQGRDPEGRWIGMLRVRGDGRDWVRAALEALEQDEETRGEGMPELLNRLVADGHPVRVMFIHGHWLDVNNLDDLQRADAFARGAGTGAGQEASE